MADSVEETKEGTGATDPTEAKTKEEIKERQTQPEPSGIERTISFAQGLIGGGPRASGSRLTA